MTPVSASTDYFVVLFRMRCSCVRLRSTVVGCWTCDQQVVGSTPGRHTFGCSLGQAVHTHLPLSASSISLLPAQGGRVTVGLASHWPYVTHNSGISTHGLMAMEREMRPCLRCSWNRVILPLLFLTPQSGAEQPSHQPGRGTGVRELMRGLVTLPQRWIQELLVARDRDGNTQEDPLAVHCFCV